MALPQICLSSQRSKHIKTTTRLKNSRSNFFANLLACNRVPLPPCFSFFGFTQKAYLVTTTVLIPSPGIFGVPIITHIFNEFVFRYIIIVVDLVYHCVCRWFILGMPPTPGVREKSYHATQDDASH